MKKRPVIKLGDLVMTTHKFDAGVDHKFGVVIGSMCFIDVVKSSASEKKIGVEPWSDERCVGIVVFQNSKIRHWWNTDDQWGSMEVVSRYVDVR